MNITYFAIFLEGLLSFLSPCVLPLLPLYMSYLAGNNKTVDESGNVKYDQIKVFFTTLFFVLGICLTFIVLSFSIGKISEVIKDYSLVISIIGGTLLIIFGLHELGIIKISVLDKEYKLNINLHLENMSNTKAFLLGLLFSIGWSPCIGPMLSNALLMASTSSDGYLYLVAYGLGLIIPFLITGLVTTQVLNFFKKKKGIINTVIKISGIVLICFGAYMISDSSKKISGLIEKPDDQYDITNVVFKDFNGKDIRISDYKGKYLFINFSATWCTYCNEEMSEFERFASENDVECIYAYSPINERSENAINDFIKEKNPSIRVLIDDSGALFRYCSVTSFPQTYVIDPDGEFLAYLPGATDVDGFIDLFNFAKELYSEK